MNTDVSRDLTRRQILAAAAGTIGTLALTGCAGTRRRRPLSTDPIWSDADHARTRDPIRDSGAAEPVAPPNAPAIAGKVMPREAWTREGPRTWLANPMGRIDRITVHHDGMPPVTIRSRNEAAARIDLIRRAHLGRGWADIGYHYVVDPQGRVWQGRPRSLQGAHVKHNNEHNLGILVMGNFMEQRPTDAALASLDQFVLANMRAFGVPLRRVQTHREIRPTACPGTHLQAYMDRTRARGGTMAARV